MALPNINAITPESGVETVGSFTNCVFRTQLTATIVVVVIIIIPELKRMCYPIELGDLKSVIVGLYTDIEKLKYDCQLCSNKNMLICSPPNLTKLLELQ
jgi:hypothetical protein